MTTERNRYEWLVPIDSYGFAHAFVVREPLSICVRHERWPHGQLGWEHEGRGRGEPQRAHCRHCVEVLAHPDNIAMTEVTP